MHFLMTGLRLRIFGALAALALAVSAVGLVVSHKSAPAHAEGRAAVVTLPPTSTTAEPLPVPSTPPDDPYAAEPLRQLGTIEIPRIGLVHPIFEGVTLTTIDHGPGHWPGTAMPG